MFAVEELDEGLCPWCIADGSAAERFDATYTDVLDVPPGVPEEVLEEVTRRTPGFRGWQQEHWLFHCDDGAVFVGTTGDDPTTYLFRCRHCGTELSYSDFS